MKLEISGLKLMKATKVVYFLVSEKEDESVMRSAASQHLKQEDHFYIDPVKSADELANGWEYGHPYRQQLFENYLQKRYTTLELQQLLSIFDET